MLRRMDVAGARKRSLSIDMFMLLHGGSKPCARRKRRRRPLHAKSWLLLLRGCWVKMQHANTPCKQLQRLYEEFGKVGLQPYRFVSHDLPLAASMNAGDRAHCIRCVYCYAPRSAKRDGTLTLCFAAGSAWLHWWFARVACVLQANGARTCASLRSLS